MGNQQLSTNKREAHADISDENH